MGVSDYKVWKLIDIYVDGARFDQNLSNIDTFGLDETSVAKGHDYITLFVDLYKKAVAHISDGKSHKTFTRFCLKCLEKIRLSCHDPILNLYLQSQNRGALHQMRPLH